MKKNIDLSIQNLFLTAINNENCEELKSLCSVYNFENYTFLSSFNNFNFVKYSIIRNKLRSMEVLVDNGASVKPSMNIYPLLELTTLENYTLDQVKLLVDRGADVNEENPLGFTPFLNVSYDNNLEIAIYLAQK